MSQKNSRRRPVPEPPKQPQHQPEHTIVEPSPYFSSDPFQLNNQRSNKRARFVEELVYQTALTLAPEYPSQKPPNISQQLPKLLKTHLAALQATPEVQPADQTSTDIQELITLALRAEKDARPYQTIFNSAQSKLGRFCGDEISPEEYQRQLNKSTDKLKEQSHAFWEKMKQIDLNWDDITKQDEGRFTDAELRDACRRPEGYSYFPALDGLTTARRQPNFKVDSLLKSQRLHQISPNQIPPHSSQGLAAPTTAPPPAPATATGLNIPIPQPNSSQLYPPAHLQSQPPRASVHMGHII